MITFRPASPADLSMVLSCRVRESISWVDPGRYQRELAVGSYRPEWTWLAQDNGTLVGRAVWWALPGQSTPTVLDCLWTAPTVDDRPALAAELLRTGHAALRANGTVSLPDYEIDLAPAWQQDADATAAVAWRQSAAHRAGLTHSVERLSFTWTPPSQVPAASPRLVFSKETQDNRFLALFAEVARGSLDDLTRRTLAAIGADAQARDDLDFYLGLPGERDWWRVAHTTAGEVVGFALPTRSAYTASVGYLGVLPQHRGHGYVTDLLGEITRQHAHRGVTKITGTADATNTDGRRLRPRRLRPHRRTPRAVRTTVTSRSPERRLSSSPGIYAPQEWGPGRRRVVCDAHPSKRLRDRSRLSATSVAVITP